MSGRAVIFGAGGQDGYFLREYLQSLGHQVFAFDIEAAKWMLL